VDEVSVRELRNYGGHVLDRVQQGETVTITRDGAPVAMLSPLPKPHVSTRVILERWQHIPKIDGEQLRRDLAELLDLDL
jgi:prevent-host-death family protein